MATKYKEVTIYRTRIVEEEAVLAFTEEKLREMSNEDLAAEAEKYGCFYQVDSTVTELTTEDTTREDESADGLGNISDDGEA